MKILEVLDKKVGNTTYKRFRINLPKKVVEDSGLKDKEVKITEKHGKIVIERM